MPSLSLSAHNRRFFTFSSHLIPDKFYALSGALLKTALASKPHFQTQFNALSTKYFQNSQSNDTIGPQAQRYSARRLALCRSVCVNKPLDR
jgi:hypothetical protein